MQKRGDVQFADGNSKASGTVYFAPDAELRQLLDDTYAAFAVTNPLHADVFPSVRRMEAEVVSMVGGFLGGVPHQISDCTCSRSLNIKGIISASVPVDASSAVGLISQLLELSVQVAVAATLTVRKCVGR
jgi:sphinganine-1-phosphate aldolase